MSDFITEICDKTYEFVLADGDVNSYAEGTRKAMAALLDMCDIFQGKDEEYLTQSSISTRGLSCTDILIQEFITFCGFNYDGPDGGSLADYCASAACRATEKYTLRLRPDKLNEFVDKIIPEIKERALYPVDEIDTLKQLIELS